MPRSPSGPWLMVAASAAFTAMIALVKHARSWDYETAELIGWRALVAIPALMLLTGVDWRVTRPWLVLLRCLLGFGAMFSFYSATAGLGIGELSVLSKLQPLFVAVVAPLTLGRSERPTPGVLVALALGMLGTVVLVWPVLDEAPVRWLSAGFAILAAVFSCLAHTTLRALGATERPAAVVFWFQLAVGLGALLAILLGPSTAHVPAPPHLPTLAGIGLSAMLGQVWMTHAYQVDRAARVAAASYVSPLMGFGVDVAFFGQLPTVNAGVAALLVIAAGVVLLASDQQGAAPANPADGR